MLVALRYARSARREASVRFLSSVTVYGVALGVAALVLAVSALSGFQATLLQEVLARSPRLQVRLPEEGEREEVRRLVSSVGGVEATQVVLTGNGWLVRDGRLTGGEVLGFEREVPAWFPGAAGGPISGVVLPSELAQRWGLTPGDTIRLVSPRPTLTPLSRQMPRSRQLTIDALWDAGRSQDHDGRVAIPLEVAERLFWKSDVRLDVQIATERVDGAAAELRALLPAANEVVTYRDLNRALFFALRLEKVLMFVGVFLIVLVASQTLVSSLALVVASKRRELGVLGALGVGPKDLRRSIVLLGGVLAGMGLFLGAVLGCSAALLLDYFRLLQLPADVYVVDFVPFLLRPIQDLAPIFGATVLLAWISARSAGREVGRLEPAEALRR
jgi:lipoprotein-releasing system permease protein